MRRLTGVLVWLFAFAATPALAEAPAGLRFLETNLSSIADASPGNIGIAALDLKSGEMVSVHGDELFPMASTVKVAVAANYLAQVEYGRRDLDDRIGGQTRAQLMAAMIIHSDNRATDMLIRDLGGPREDAGLARAATNHRPARSTATSPSCWPPSATCGTCAISSTPKAMVELLRRLDSGKLLKPQSRSYLLG